MRTDAYLRRQARAKEKAAADLAALGYDTFPSDNKRICIIAARPAGSGLDVRFIRICLDEITVQDRRIAAAIRLPNVELWLRRKGRERFEHHKP